MKKFLGRTRLFSLLFLSALFMAGHAQGENFPGRNFKITDKMLKFKYQKFDGSEEALSCKHRMESEASQDWLVHCGAPEWDKAPKKFRVHLWLSLYGHQAPPKLSYEVLYWLTNLSIPGKPAGSSTTFWVHLRDPSEIMTLDVSQGVEEDVAGLYLSLRAAE